MNGGAPEWDWNVVVFCRNEQFYITDCIRTIAAAIGRHRATLTVVINGSTDDSATLASAAARRYGISCNLFNIPFGDKANAINHFFYELHEDARLFFFVDGYTKVSATAFEAMDQCLSSRPEVVAATGVALNGRTMRLATPGALTSGGQLHGQLHALRRDFVARLVARQLRVPIGLYYGDGLVGSMAMHDLDAINTPWEPQRIAAMRDATYEIPVLSPFSPHDLRRQFNRKIRQMRGRLENLAIRSIVYEHNYEGLPEYSDDMIRSYIQQHGIPRVSMQNRLFLTLALRQLQQSGKPDPTRLIPQRLPAG